MVACKLAASKSEARRLIQQGGVSVNDEKVTDANMDIDLFDGAILKKGKKVADADLRDTENVPMEEDIDAYFAREVLPYAPDAWIDKSKTKVGYEIPMTRYFYKFQEPEASSDILARIIGLEDEIAVSLKELIHREV